jgi:predicted nucleotidyltransferase
MSGLGEQIAQVLAPLTSVRVAWFFGSRAKGRHRPDSDLDLLVAYDHQLNGAAREQLRRRIVYELAGVLGRVGERADIADVRDVDSAVAFAAVAEGELVLERSKAERVATQVYVWKRYDDDVHRRDLFRKAALAAVERMTRDQR